MEELQYMGVPPAAESTPLADVRLETSPRRWVVLGVFVLVCACAGCQGPPTAGSQVLYFLLPLLLLSLPACYLVRASGLRCGVEVSGAMLTLASWMHLTAPGRFAPGRLALLGASRAFLLAAPARLAATWFGASQVSSACAVAVVASQVFGALDYPLPADPILPPQNFTHVDKVSQTSVRIVAASSVVAVVLAILLFKNMPDLPPSRTQALERSCGAPVTLKQFLGDLRSLLTNKDYLLIMAASCVNGGALNVICTVLNPVILRHFPDGGELADRLHLLLLLSGVLGATGFGVLLDHTHRFKEIMLGVYVFMALSNSAFACALEANHIVLVYITAIFLGVFLLSCLPVTVEMAAEVTYPVSESTMGSLLLIPANLMGFLTTVTFTWVMERWGDLQANLLVSASLLVGALLSALVSKNYRRLAANTDPLKS